MTGQSRLEPVQNTHLISNLNFCLTSPFVFFAHDHLRHIKAENSFTKRRTMLNDQNTANVRNSIRLKFWMEKSEVDQNANVLRVGHEGKHTKLKQTVVISTIQSVCWLHWDKGDGAANSFERQPVRNTRLTLNDRVHALEFLAVSSFFLGNCAP